METEPKQISDEELARQARTGSLSSFEELVFRYEMRLYRLMFNRCRHEADARELTQITFVTAYRSIHQLKPGHSFGAWLFTIAHRKFIDHCRAAKREQGEQVAAETWETNDPSIILSDRESAADLWQRARALLSRDQFDALWLKYQEDMSVQDIARVLGRTRTSVKVLLFRARQNLLKEMRCADQELPCQSAPLPSRRLGFQASQSAP